MRDRHAQCDDHPFFASEGGAQTPETAAKVVAKPGGGIVIQERTRSRATAYLLRPDGTAYSQLGLIALDDGTWRADTLDSCSGEAPLPK